MTSPTELADLIISSRIDENVDERAEKLIFRGKLTDEGIRARWASLRAAPPPYIRRIFISYADSDGEFEDSDIPSDTDLFRITIQKASKPDTLLLFFAHSIEANGDALATVNRVAVADMTADGAFTTELARFQIWTEDPPQPFAASEKLLDPRRLTKDFTGNAAVPSDVRPWLLRDEPQSSGPAFSAWQVLASKKLFAALSDHVALEGGVLVHHFNGPPACDICFDIDQIRSMFAKLNESAQWVFRQGTDADIRHLLLANELARTHLSSVGPSDFGNGALDSAKGAYNAYVKSSGRETLQALASLRRSVLEESQKVSERAQSLTGSLWKDLAVAGSPFVLKTIADSSKLTSDPLAGVVALAAAAFLAFVYCMQNYINYRFFRSQTDGRVAWDQALNTVLSQSELHQFADKPINDSISNYWTVARWVGTFYAVLAIVLVGFGLSELEIVDWRSFISTQETVGGWSTVPNTNTN